MAKFFDSLDTKKICLGLDPVPDNILCSKIEDKFPHAIPKELSKGSLSMLDKCWNLFSSTKEKISCVKLNSAFFEAEGSEGYLVMEILTRYIQRDDVSKPVIIDAKRGDISTSSRQYARAIFETIGADAVTLNPLMGIETLGQFFAVSDGNKGVFVLCMTSNEGSEDFLGLELKSGGYLYEEIARKCVASYGDDCGFVVGATASEETFRRIRNVAPNNCLLCPGIGAQGGILSTCLVAGGKNTLFPLSRTIRNSADPAAECDYFNDQIRQCSLKVSQK